MFFLIMSRNTVIGSCDFCAYFWSVGGMVFYLCLALGVWDVFAVFFCENEQPHVFWGLDYRRCFKNSHVVYSLEILKLF